MIPFGMLLAAVALGQPPSDQTLIYYNARMALREGRAEEAVKLWLLRNTVESRTQRLSPHDADFRSVTWAALGALGVCQDGHPSDEDGAGLWPLAIHNWLVRNRNRVPARPSRPFDAFRSGVQQSYVSIGDVLTVDQIRTVDLFRGRCAWPTLALPAAGESLFADLSDPEVAASVSRHLLERARATVARDRVQGWAAIDARLLDHELRRSDGNSEEARVLTDCVAWPIREWMALTPERRLLLFAYARDHGADASHLDRISLGMVDHLVRVGDGRGVTDVIGLRVESGLPVEPIWSGTRGGQLLALDPETGFAERGVIALHRGVRQLEGGEVSSALRSFAFALRHAPDSVEADRVHAQALRWLSHVAGAHASGEELLGTLRTLVPPQDYAALLEDLMWRAAFHADRGSYERALRSQEGRSSLDRRLEPLQPLAAGDVARFSRGIDEGLSRSPGETLRFLERMLQRLELEDADVRGAHTGTLTAIRPPLQAMADAGTSRQGRAATDLLERSRSILEGVGWSVDSSIADRAGALDPDAEVFAGSVRLAPADPLPWPFRPPSVRPPSVFAPFELVPVEWRDPSGEIVFGWRISG